VDDRALAAAESNAGWCDLVCRSHGIPTSMARQQWVALRRAPVRYPDAVTLLPGAAPDELLRLVQNDAGCSVKDSFADLDLAPLGFDELFEGRWIFRGPALPTVDAAAIWSVVETDEELGEWALAAGAPDTFRGELLRNPSLRILSARAHGAVQAGAIANRSASAVGVSNVFTTKAMAADEVWASLPTAIAGHFYGMPLAGYECGDDLAPALAAGFVAIGALRVWVRPGEVTSAAARRSAA
jgi:hypothetical protein